MAAIGTLTFYHIVFYLFQDKSLHWSHHISQSCSLQLGQLQNKLFTKRQNFYLDQIQSFCRRQIHCCKTNIISVFDRIENIVYKGENAGSQHFLLFPQYFLKSSLSESFNPLPDTPILGSSSSATNRDMMAKIWINGDSIICLSRKHCGKRRNCSLRVIFPFPTMFSKGV